MKRKRLAQTAEKEFSKWLSEHGDEVITTDVARIPEPDEQEISRPQEIMAEAIEHLQGRQKEVYLLHMRLGKSLSEVAEMLKMSKGTAQTYLGRAITFVTKHCQQAIEKGRV